MTGTREVENIYYLPDDYPPAENDTLHNIYYYISLPNS